jgi:hypothetical protein
VNRFLGSFKGLQIRALNTVVCDLMKECGMNSLSPILEKIVYCRNWDILRKCLILNNRRKGINEIFLFELLKGDAFDVRAYAKVYQSQISMVLSWPTYSIVILLWRKFICDKKSASGMLINPQVAFTFTRQRWSSFTFSSYLALLV